MYLPARSFHKPPVTECPERTEVLCRGCGARIAGHGDPSLPGEAPPEPGGHSSQAGRFLYIACAQVLGKESLTVDLIPSDLSSISLPSLLSVLDTGPSLASHSRRNTHEIQGMYCVSGWNLVRMLLSLQRNLTLRRIARPCLHTALNVCLLPLTSVEPLILVISQSKESYRQGSPETLDLKPSHPKE